MSSSSPSSSSRSSSLLLMPPAVPEPAAAASQPSGSGSGSSTGTKRRRQTITDQAQVDQAMENCQINSGNNVISCFPTPNTVVPQHQWASFVWNSRRPELTQTNLVDIFLFRGDSQQQLLHFPHQVNPPDRAGLLRTQVNDTWFGADGLDFKGQNVSFPYYWVIIRSDASLSTGNFVPQPIFSAVQTAVLDSVASPTSPPLSSSSSFPSTLPTALSGSGSKSGSSSSSSSPSSTTQTGGNVQHASSASSFPRWAIAVIVILGFLAIAASCILVFVILRRLRRRQQRSSSSSSRNSMGSASPMMPRDHNQQQQHMVQRYDSAGSPLLSPAALGASASHRNSALGGGGGSTTHDGASAISDTGGPFSGADAAIMADAFRKMLRKPDFAGRPVEEGESPEQADEEGAGMDVGDPLSEEGGVGMGGEGEQVLRGQLAEEGRDIRSVSSSRGVRVEGAGARGDVDVRS